MVKKAHQQTSSQKVVSALAGSLTTAFLLTPLDVVKTRLQVDSEVPQTKKCYLFCNGIMKHIYPLREIGQGVYDKPKSGLEAFFRIVRYEGPTALWSGLGPSLLSALPATIVYFTIFENMKSFLFSRPNKLQYIDNETILPIWIPMMSGFCARVCAQTISAPMEIIRIKKQASTLPYSVINNQLKETMGKYGLYTLWSGLLPTLMRDCPFSSIYWGMYELIKSSFAAEEYPFFVFTMFSGMASGMVAAALTTPFDVITTRVTVDIGDVIFNEGSDTKEIPKVSLMRKVSAIYKEIGFKGMFAGAFPRLLRVPLACGVMVTVYEHLNNIFHKINSED